MQFKFCFTKNLTEPTTLNDRVTYCLPFGNKVVHIEALLDLINLLRVLGFDVLLCGSIPSPSKKGKTPHDTLTKRSTPRGWRLNGLCEHVSVRKPLDGNRCTQYYSVQGE